MEPAELLRSVRRRRGLTQAALARRAGTSQPVVSAYEHGRRDPSFGTLRRLVEAGGERLVIGARVATDGPPPAADLQEHGRRLVDVLLLADAIPARRRSSVLRAPRLLFVTVAVARSLPERIVAIDAVLTAFPHAFGGALALAYYAEPRATIDIDLNLFVPADRYAEIAAPLVGLGVDADAPEAVAAVGRDGQTRVMWDRTPIDMFFAYDAFHDAAAAARRTVPFADTDIPILAPEHLLVCKVVFDRPRDWVDIDAMLDAGVALDTAEVMRWVGRIAGDADPRYERIAALLTSGRGR